MVAGDGPLPNREEVMRMIGQELRDGQAPLRVIVQRVSQEMNDAIMTVVNHGRPREPLNDNNPRPQ